MDGLGAGAPTPGPLSSLTLPGEHSPACSVGRVPEGPPSAIGGPVTAGTAPVSIYEGIGNFSLFWFFLFFKFFFIREESRQREGKEQKRRSEWKGKEKNGRKTRETNTGSLKRSIRFINLRPV